MRASSAHRSAFRPCPGRARTLSLVVCVAWIVLPGGTALASDSLRANAAEPVVSIPIVMGIDFDTFPAHLLPSHAVRRPPPAAAGASPLAAQADGVPVPPPAVILLTSMLEWPGFSPLEMEQPVRFYESDVLVKFRAPGGRSSFATVELIF